MQSPEQIANFFHGKGLVMTQQYVFIWHISGVPYLFLDKDEDEVMFRLSSSLYAPLISHTACTLRKQFISL